MRSIVLASMLMLSLILSPFCKAESNIPPTPQKSAAPTASTSESTTSKLTPAQQKRVARVTKYFEEIDGVGLEKAIELYEQDKDPERLLTRAEEMLRIYLQYCQSHCSTQQEKIEVYRALQERSIYNKEVALSRLRLSKLSKKEAADLMDQFGLPPLKLEKQSINP